MSLQDDIEDVRRSCRDYRAVIDPGQVDRVCSAAQESEMLRAEVKAWKDRFRALVGKDSPDAAGNAVLTLRAALPTAQQKRDELQFLFEEAENLLEEAQRQARVLAKFKEVCAAQGHYHADTISALEQKEP